MAGDLTAILQVAAGKTRNPGGRVAVADEQVLRYAAESVSSLSHALELGGSAAPSTGQLNVMLMRKEQLERRAGMLQEQVDTDEGRVQQLRRALVEERSKKSDKGGVFADVNLARKSTQRLVRLEKDLASQRSRLDALNSSSVATRKKIDKHREVAVAHREVFTKVRESLLEARQRVVDSLQEANEVQEDGDAIKQEMDELVAMNRDEAKAHAVEVAKIDAEIASVRDGKYESVEFVKEAEEDGPGSGDLTEEEEKELRERIVHLDEQMKAVEQDIRGLYEQTSQLQEIFQLMLKRAGLETLDDLIDMFTGEESHKYEQYGYVQRLNKELKGLEVRLAAIISEKEGARQLIARQDASRREQLAVARTEMQMVRSQVEEHRRTLRGQQGVCERLTRAGLDVYMAGGGASSTIIALGVLVGLDQKGNVLPRPADADDPGQEAPSFELTTDTVRHLMSAVESRVSEVTMIFTSLLQRPEERDVILEAAKRPGSARPVSRSRGSRPAKPGQSRLASSPSKSAPKADLPAVPKVEVARMVSRFKAGPLGTPKNEGEGGGLFRLPDLTGPLGGGSHRPLLGMLSAPSVEEVNMDEDEDDAAADGLPQSAVRPVRRSELGMGGRMIRSPGGLGGSARRSFRQPAGRRPSTKDRRRSSAHKVRLGSRKLMPTTPIRGHGGARA